MNDGTLKAYSLIIVSIVLALLLTIIPLPKWMVWYWPLWIVLVVLYWALAMPDRMGVVKVWLIGLLADAVHGTLLGEHALALTLTVYLLIKLRPQILLFNFFQRIFIIFGLILIYQIIIFLTEGLTGRMPQTWFYWMASVTSTLMWPWIYTLLQSCRRHFNLMDNGMRRFNYGRE